MGAREWLLIPGGPTCILLPHRPLGYLPGPTLLDFGFKKSLFVFVGGLDVKDFLLYNLLLPTQLRGYVQLIRGLAAIYTRPS